MGWVKKPEKVFEIDLTKNKHLLYRLLLRIFKMLTLHKTNEVFHEGFLQ